MRTGLGFASGGCRALALFGVVFAVGAGSASAQITISGDQHTTLKEGGQLEWTITVKWRQAVGAGGRTVTVTPRVTAATSGVTTVGGPDAVTQAEISGGAVDYRASAPSNTSIVLPVPAGPTSGTAPSSGTVTRTYAVTTNADTDAEDEKFNVSFSVVSGGLLGQDGQVVAAPADGSFVRSITIEDTQEQTFVWNPPADDDASPKEGTPVTRTFRPYPAPWNLTWNAVLSVDESGYAPSLGATTFSLIFQSRNVSITPPDNDGNREDDTIEVRAFLAGTNDLLPGYEPLEITFADLHALPEADDVEAKAYEDREGDATGRTTTEADSVMEGGEPVHVRVTIDRGTNGYPSGEKLVVRPEPVDPAQRADYRIEPNSIEVPTGNGKRHADFVLYARPDDDVGAETLELNLVTTGEKAANGPGEVVGRFSIDVVDATTPLIAPAAQAAAEAAVMAAMGGGPLNPGDSFTLDTNDLFNWAPAAVDAAFAASVRGAAASVSTSGETVTVEAKEAGDAAVTVTATGTARGSSAVSTSQTVANTASVTFDVQVVLADLAITLSGPENANVVEGGQPARVTATANRAVTKDTTVRLSATGGDAVPGDYSVGNVVIEAGDDMGSTLLTATADDEAERSETLTLRGVFVDDESGEDGQTVNSLTFNLWDAAVPALPVAAQLLLAALLAVGGCRRYLRRR